MVVICGKVSGNLELIELEGRTMDPDTLAILEKMIRETGCEPTWELLMGVKGYSERSPSGGPHLLHRSPIVTFPEDGLAEDASDPPRVLAETLGEGGYVSWPLGWLGPLHRLSWELTLGIWPATHEHLGGSLSASRGDDSALDLGSHIGGLAINWFRPHPRPLPPSKGKGRLAISGAGLSPGDDFERQNDWSDSCSLMAGPWNTSSTGMRLEPSGQAASGGSLSHHGPCPTIETACTCLTSTKVDAEQSYPSSGAERGPEPQR